MPGTLAVLRRNVNTLLLSALALLVTWWVSSFVDFLQVQDWWYLEVFFGVPFIALLLILINAFRLQSEANSTSLLMLRRVGLVTGCAVLGLSTLWFVSNALVLILDNYYNYRL